MNPTAIARRGISVAGFFVLLLSMAGCATPSDRGMPGSRVDLLDFLKDGSTTREEAIVCLGQPSAVLERENLLVFCIGEDVNKAYFVIDQFYTGGRVWETARYSLVLVFDADDVLQKHNLVAVK
jgi:hypothetical protein